MLPGPLVGLYQQYKEDTNAVAAWLASTAKACGFSDTLLSKPGDSAEKDGARAGGGASASGSGSKRLKGKARKEAKKAASFGPAVSKPAASTQAAKKTGPKFTIAIRDFVPLAEFVAASKSTAASIPATFISALSRVITTRSAFGDRMAEHGAERDPESDKRHGYFVGVLQKVYEALKPRMPPATQEDLNNRFAGLTVYEPSEEFLNAPDIERPAPPEKATSGDATYEAEPMEDLEEVLFAYTLMITDLGKIRSYIEWIWKNVRDGVSDLAAAALATNTACDLARNMMEDVLPLFKRYGGAVEIARKFFMAQCLMKGFPMPSILGLLDISTKHETYDVASDTYVLAIMMLESFIPVLYEDKRDVPLYREGMYGMYDPSRSRATMSTVTKFNQDKIILMEYFSEMSTVNRSGMTYPVQDEFLRGMQELDDTRTVPMYLAFATQIFLDIHHLLGEDVFHAHKTFISQLDFMYEDLEQHLEFHKDLKIAGWPAKNDMALRQMLKKMEWIKQDPVYLVKVKAYQRIGMPATMPPHRITKYSPVLSGLLLYHFRAEMWDIGIAVANAWGSVTYSQHLYAAMQMQGLIGRSEDANPDAKSWPDMDLVLGLLGAGNFFVGAELPSTPEDAFTKFCLQMGTTAAAFTKSKNARKKAFSELHSKAGPRCIKDACPVSCMFMDRYLRNTGQVDWTPEHVDKVVSLSAYEEEGSEQDGTLMLGQIDDPEKLREKRRKAAAADGKKKKAAAEGARLRPEMLVRSLVLALQAESIEMAFPYLTMHRAAWAMLRAVREACDPLLREMVGPAYLERENQLPWVVGWVLMALYQGDPGLLRAAAEVVRDRGAPAADGARAMLRLRKMGFPVQFVRETE